MKTIGGLGNAKLQLESLLGKVSPWMKTIGGLTKGERANSTEIPRKHN